MIKLSSEYQIRYYLTSKSELPMLTILLGVIPHILSMQCDSAQGNHSINQYLSYQLHQIF